jgi:hypothetical protein
MDSKELIASNLVIAFYSAVEPLPAYLGEERRMRNKPLEGLDMRNPSISPGEVFEVYHRFLQMLNSDS